MDPYNHNKMAPGFYPPQNQGYGNNAPYPQMPTPDFSVNMGMNQQPGYPGSGYPGSGYPSNPGYPSNQPGYPGGPQYPGGQGYPNPQQPPYGGAPFNPMHGTTPSFYNDQDNGYNPSVPVHGPPTGYPPYGGPSQPTYPGAGGPSQPTYPGAGGYQPPPQNPPFNPSPAANTRPSIYPDLGGNYGAGAGNFVPPVIPDSTNVQSNFEMQCQGTVKPFPGFNPADDAHRLYKAMKGLGTNETVLIEILCQRTYAQRKEIISQYKTQFGKDMVSDVKKETGGNFHDLLKALLMSPAEFCAHEIRDSLAGIGTDEIVLIDILCSLSNSEMVELRNAYRTMYKKDIEKEVRSDVSGYFQRLLVSLMNANRSTAPPDPARAAQQARELHKAGEKRMGTDEVKFNQIFAAESFPQLRLVFDEYQKLTGHPIEKAIKSEMSGDVERAFLAIAKIARNPAAYFAERFHQSMIGMGTKDKQLIRNMVLRCEKDMREIKIEFQRKYGKSLESFVKGDCSGDYKRALRCLIGDPNWK